MKRFFSKGLTVFVCFVGLALGGWAQGQNTAVLTVHAEQTQEAISPYIYGQFIEHLGRCIYGGIWAEMLQDRKFYFPIKDEFKPYSVASDRDRWGGGDFPVITGSPWKVIGPEGTVQMLKEDPFVGEQTPEITAPGSIQQSELALEEGRTYEGYIIISGDPDAAPVQVKLMWGENEKDTQTFNVKKLSNEYKKYTFQFKAKASTDNGLLKVIGAGKGAFRIGTLSLMPADNVKGFRADTLALLKELDSPVYRWPGGNFVSDYNWKDGIGDRDKRPPRKNPAWTGIEPNDVGIHEFMELCDLIDTEPYIAVNTGKGTAEVAAEEVQYCNGSTDTPMGKWRAENGHAKPFKVKFWAVGNEMYGNWQIGHMPLADYMKKHQNCVDLMRQEDSSIELVGVGAVGEWSRNMLTYCSDHMDLLSEHIYCKSKQGLAEHAAQIRDAIKRVADAHREYRKEIPALQGKDIRIAMDEWNYWYGPYIYGELGVQYHLQDALGIAAGLHEYFRNSDIYYMANYAQTVNVIGAIKTSKTDAVFDTTGLVLKLYRQEFGEIPLQVSGVDLPLDASAALSKDKKTLTVAVVNPTENSVSLDCRFEGVESKGKGKVWTITGTDKMAHNVPGQEPQVVIEEGKVQSGESLEIRPMSVTLFAFNVK